MRITGESKRQIEHMLPLSFAFLLRYLTLTQAVLCCMAALIYGLFGSARLNRSGVRPAEAQRGFSVGKLSYALVVLGLILIFHNRMHIAAGAWAVLALGDSVSTLAGRAWGRKKLPWSTDKTWVGTASFVLSAWAGSVVLVYWTAQGLGLCLPPAWVVITTCAAASLVSAVVESLPLPVNDNITSPLAAAGVMAWIL